MSALAAILRLGLNNMGNSSENPVFEIAMAYQKTAALIAATKLDIFTLVGSGKLTADDLSFRTGASVRGLRILCDFLTVIGLLKKEASAYALTPAAGIMLDGASPFAIGSIVDFVAAPEMLRLFFEDPVSYVQSGGAKGQSNLTPDNPIWVRFARAMAPLAKGTAKRVAAHVATEPDPPRTVLDVAAGHGLYGIEVAKSLPNALITAIDSGDVLVLAEENAKAAGVNRRVRTIAGNALTLEWGREYDLILLPNFLHHFDVKVCTSLLRKVRASLSIGGRALVVDFVPNEDRVSPPIPAMFAFWMLASTPGGDAYTARELHEMARNAGFRAATTHQLSPTPESLVILEA
jgi:ubiquinone/menaquinone biosynthesis C-methylase UbiE